MRQLAKRVLAVAVVAFSTACSDSTGPESNVTGTYTLRTINGGNVPVVLYQDATYRLEIVSGSMAISANNTFTSTHSFRETEGSQTLTSNVVCSGSYSQNGNSILLDETETSNGDCGGTFNGTLSGSSLTVAYDATLQAVYSR